uniref:Uncharacterized protein n=1 Tax=Prolemur simus TaxID=1328070 RepID=A0A8C8ZFD6_PROSS
EGIRVDWHGFSQLWVGERCSGPARWPSTYFFFFFFLRHNLALLPGLECHGISLAHSNLKLLVSFCCLSHPAFTLVALENSYSHTGL